jgi:dTDP-L-rhamnose 4-epimerase
VEVQLARRDWEVRCQECGSAMEPLPTREDKPLNPASIYAISKMDQELMCLAVGRAYDIPVVALRYFNCYGARQALSNPYTGAAAIFSGRLLNGRAPVIFEDGRQMRDLVHVSDLARANLLAIESDAANGEAVNVGSGRPMSIEALARTLARRLNVDIEPEIVGQFRAGDIRHCYADIEKARHTLGFEPAVPFDQGIDDLVAWVRDQTANDRIDHARGELEQRRLTR